MDRRLIFTALFSLLTVLASARTVDSLTHAAVAGPQDSVAIRTVDRSAVDSLALLETVDSELVALRRGAGGDEVILEVAGFGLTLGQASGGNGKKIRPRMSALLCNGLELGFNALTGLDYSDYPAASEGFLDTRIGNSFHFSLTTIGLAVEMGRKRNFEFSTGLRYTVDNYRLTDASITLARHEGMIVPVALDERADKSKLRITSLGFPLQFTVEPVRRLRIALIGYCDFTLGSNAIYKRPKVREALSGVNVFRFGLGASVAYHRVGLYIRYGVTPLFKSGEGPVCRPLSFGVSLFL